MKIITLFTIALMLAAQGLLPAQTANLPSGTATSSYPGMGYGAVKSFNTNMTAPGNALDFDGVDDYVIIQDESAFDFNNEMTIEAWIKVDAFTTAWQAIVTKGDNAWRLHRYNETDHISFGTMGLSNLDLESTTNVNDGQWHHVAGVFDGSTKYLYVDGALDASVGVTGTIQQTDDAVYIAENSGAVGRYFDGQMDEVRIWDTARSQNEISNNMHTVLAGNESGLIAYYRFDQTAGSVLPDCTANELDGTLQNMDDSDWVTSTAPVSDYIITEQVAINKDGANPDVSAILDVRATDGGFLPPRMTTAQRNTIASPAEGLIIYNTEKKRVEQFDGNEWTGFRCGVSQLEGDDGNLYNTVQIGTQCWMAENLRTGAMINNNADQTDNGITEKYCYGNDTTNCYTYGGLYKWDEMMQYETTQGSRGICPHNWHIPTYDEWSTLINHLGSNSTSGGPMKTTGTLESGTGLWQAPNTGATNSSGFYGLPGGYLMLIEDGPWSLFENINANGYFWTSTVWIGDPGERAWVMELVAGNASAYCDPMGHRVNSYSVRCIKD